MVSPPRAAASSVDVRNAAAAGASVVLVNGTSLPAGALDLEDGIAVPVVAVPADAGNRPLQRPPRARQARSSVSAAEALPNGSLMDIAPFSSGGVAFDGRVQARPRRSRRRPRHVGRGRRRLRHASPGRAPQPPWPPARLHSSWSARPGLGALELKSALVGSGGRLRRGDAPLAVTSQGGGLVDPIHAVTAELAVEPATLAFGRADGAKWSAARTLTVRNVSSRPLTVGLGLLTDDPAGLSSRFRPSPRSSS